MPTNMQDTQNHKNKQPMPVQKDQGHKDRSRDMDSPRKDNKENEAGHKQSKGNQGSGNEKEFEYKVDRNRDDVEAKGRDHLSGAGMNNAAKQKERTSQDTTRR